MDGRGTIVILIDALGYDLAVRYGFRPSGMSRPSMVRTVLGFSQAALTTMLTGLEPSRHGLWMMYAFSDGHSPFRWLRLVPCSSERRLLRNAVSLVLSRLYGVESYYSLYSVPREVLPYLDLSARRRMFAPGGAGAVRNIFDELAGRGDAWRVWDHTTDERESFDALERTVERGDRSFRLLYTAGLDSLLHRYGTGAAQVGRRLEWYRDRIERILAKTSGERIVVLGDHGMCEVSNSLDLMGRVGELGLSIPEDFVPFYDSTMARFRVRTEKARSRLMELLSGLEGGVLIGDDEARDLGVEFPDGRFGDLIFLLECGMIVAPSYMGGEMMPAMHGYDPRCPCMHAALFSNDESDLKPASLEAVARYLLPGYTGGERE